ncbi:MAG: ABC transporter permease [Defluviitaleaceae bacterium]|nr:ABC transporter permease [Defluviitaleaceae bacterium]
MRKNIFFKSSLRQPLRTFILMLLIAVTSFTFVLRTVEYMVVNERINEIARYHRSIGFLQGAGDNTDVTVAADIISQSPFVAVEDRQGGAEALLVGLTNADTARWAYVNDYNFAFFSGRLFGVEHTQGIRGYIHDIGDARFHYVLTFEVSSVLWGYPDLVRPFGLIPVMVTDFDSSFLSEMTVGEYYFVKVASSTGFSNGYHAPNFSNITMAPFDGPSHQWRFPPLPPYEQAQELWLQFWEDFRIPNATDEQHAFMLEMVHSFDIIEDGWDNEYADGLRIILGAAGMPFWSLWQTFLIEARQTLVQNQTWFIPIPEGYEVNFHMPGLAELYWFEDYIREMELAQRAITLITTNDMTTMPQTQMGNNSLMQLVGGRWIDYDDYLEQRPVAMIHRQFAAMRGLSVGDTLSVKVPYEQVHYGVQNLGAGAANTSRRDISTGHLITTGGTGGYIFLQQDIISSREGEMIELELEIVGVYGLNLPRAGRNDMNHWNHAGHNTTLNTFIYIPSSLNIPQPAGDFANTVFDFAYNFTLNDARDEHAFIQEHEELFASMGFTITFLEHGSDAFWEIANPIILSVTLNLFVFWGVLVLVFGLVVFLFLRQRRRDYAISRSLGASSGVLFRRKFITLTIIALPMIIGAGIIAWHYGLDLASQALAGIGSYTSIDGYNFEVYLSQIWLAVMLAVIFVVLIVPFGIGVSRLGRKPVLELLQGAAAKRATETTNNYTHTTNNLAQTPYNRNVNTTEADDRHTYKASKGGKTSQKILALWRHSLRHILRSPLKSSLTMVVAMVFVLAVGWLLETIARNQIEIDYMYNTTFVRGDVRPISATEIIQGREMGDVIRAATVNSITDSEFIYETYAEALTNFAFIFSGNAPENLWDGIHNPFSIVRLAGRDAVFAFNDFEAFVLSNTRGAGHDMPGFEFILDNTEYEYLRVDFIEGLTGDYFSFIEGFPIPVIVSAEMLYQRGFELGEYVYISHLFPNPFDTNEDDPASNQEVVVPVRIIGTHNRHILAGEDFRDAILMHSDALQRIMGDNIGYTRLSFAINTAYNRNIGYAQDEIRTIIESVGAGHTGLTVIFNDSELNNVVIPMENNLSLLLLLYPVAIGVALAIGAGLAFLITLQNAKVVAIMRVLGATTPRTGIALWIETFLVCLIGLSLGVGLILFFNNITPTLFTVLYLVAVVIGSIVGIVLVTKKPPLELLQVKE